MKWTRQESNLPLRVPLPGTGRAKLQGALVSCEGDSHDDASRCVTAGSSVVSRTRPR